MTSARPHIDPAAIDPQRLTVLLEENGWRIVGGREGVYTRLASMSDTAVGRASSVTVPLDRSAKDYTLLMSELITRLQEPAFVDAWSRTIAPRLAIRLADEIRFHKETSAPKGFIPWKLGEELLEAARRTLLAGAKAHVERKRRFINSHGQFASRYLDRVLMGQTGIASYVVTAFVPVGALVPLSGSSSHGKETMIDEAALPMPVDIMPTRSRTAPRYSENQSVASRDVTKSVTGALDATVEALAHFHATGSLSAFEAGVTQGISYELTTALQGLTRNSDGSEIVVEWDSADRESLGSYSSVFSFTPDDTQPLSKASIRFAADEEPSQARSLVGRVHLLSKKEVGGPGVFGMEVFEGEIKKVRVRLSNSEQYHQAVRAHDDDLAIRVSGELERDGNTFWLYHATIEGVEGPLDEVVQRISRFNPSEIPGQMTIY